MGASFCAPRAAPAALSRGVCSDELEQFLESERLQQKEPTPRQRTSCTPCRTKPSSRSCAYCGWWPAGFLCAECFAPTCKWHLSIHRRCGGGFCPPCKATHRCTVPRHREPSERMLGEPKWAILLGLAAVAAGRTSTLPQKKEYKMLIANLHVPRGTAEKDTKHDNRSKCTAVWEKTGRGNE